MLYSERRKQLQFSYQVKAEGWMALPLSEHTKGWRGNIEKAAGSSRHTSWPYCLQKELYF